MQFEELTIKHGDVLARIAPARGALVTELHIGDKKVLYLDRASFEDETKNVRGGIPVLFPYAGKLQNDVFKATGKKIGQHGFGRNREWRVKEQKPWGLRMELIPEEADREVYPFPFVTEQCCTILPCGLLLELSIFNAGDRPMPVSPGWHPYFSCPPTEKHKLKTSLTNVDASQFSDQHEFDFGVEAPPDGRAIFEVPSLGTLTLSFSPEMRTIQFWSLPGKDFVCLEPYTGPHNNINTDHRIDIRAGTAHTFWTKIELE